MENACILTAIYRMTLWDVKSRLMEVYGSPGDGWRAGRISDEMEARIETALFQEVSWSVREGSDSLMQVVYDLMHEGDPT